MSIELSPQLQSVLEQEAARRGTTPQSLAIQFIESQLPADAAAEELSSDQAMLDRWQKHLASLPPPSGEPRPDWLRSDNVSEAFGKILEEQRRQGRL